MCSTVTTTLPPPSPRTSCTAQRVCLLSRVLATPPPPASSQVTLTPPSIHNRFSLEFHSIFTAVLAKELKDCASSVDAAQLERARNATASIVLINSEHGAINAEDMGRQVMFTGGRVLPQQLLQQISAVTAQDIQRVAKGLVQSKLAVAAVGDVSYVPSYDTLQALFK
jgi:hypothetical protein